MKKEDKKVQLTIKLTYFIVAHGFQNYTMTELAKKISVSRAGIYLYFKNKEDVVRSVISLYADFVRELFSDKKTKTYSELTFDHFALLINKSDRLLTELQEDYPTLYHDFNQIYKDYENFFLSAMKKLQETDFIDSTVDLSLLYFQDTTMLTAFSKEALVQSRNISSWLEDYWQWRNKAILTQELSPTENLAFKEKILSGLVLPSKDNAE